MTSNEDTQQSAVSPEDVSKRPRSRSPQPYHRQSISLSTKEAANLSEFVLQDDVSESSSERGTEADDEKGPILRALPAPPLKYRKGWKGSKSPLDLTPAVTPLLFPSGAEEEHTYFSTTRQKGSRNGKDRRVARLVSQEQYKKYTTRRRAEIVRRATEVALLAAIVVLTYRKALQTLSLPEWGHEVYITGRIIIMVYAFYPVGVALRLFNAGWSLYRALRRAFHLPSRFDPGPLLYPVVIPICTALSLADSHDFIVHVNLILAIASVPPSLVAGTPSPFSTLLHWALCLLPQSKRFLQVEFTKTGNVPQQLLSFSPAFDKETLALLFPLHQTILAILQHLTTTSLDPAELQLLSAGLVNLLLFASSPQAQILRTAIWIGPLCLFIFCEQPLAWEVTLARIPAWKFVRNKSPKSGLLSKLEGAVYLLLSSQHRRHSTQLDSDDEDYEHLRSARKKTRRYNPTLTVRTSSLVTDVDHSSRRHQNGFAEGEVGSLTRAVTLPERRQSFPAPKPAIHTPRVGFLALTYAQAQAAKWLFAAYIYLATLLIVTVIVLPHIGQGALYGHEPLGWALGYLFGNIPQLRFFIVSHNLEKWICLPQHAAQVQTVASAGWLEKYRQMQQGSANTRLFLAAYCLFVLTCGLVTVFQLGAVAEVDTRRKVFHGIMVAMLLPTIPVDPCFIALALIVILVVFLLLDMFRASQVPPISKPLTVFLAPYVDGRDHRGPVVISHIFLLIGCAIPLWLALAGTTRSGDEPWAGWDVTARDLSMISGVVCVGMGDAAASLIGRRFGRTKWFWGGGKSIEGSCAFTAAVTVGLMASYFWLRVGGWVEWDIRAIPQASLKAVIAASGASLLESVLTAANDNVVVPIGLWLLVRGLQL